MEGMTMAEKTPWEELAELIGAGTSETVPAIFQALADENEAKVLLAASPPATIAELSEKTGLEAGDIEKMVDPLFRKGLLFKSKKKDAIRYYRVRQLMQFHDSTAVMDDPPSEMLDLWKQWTQEEWGEISKKYEQLLPGSAVRVLPVNVSIDLNTQVLPFEDVRSLIDRAPSVAVTRCSCRVIDGACGKPLEVCIQLGRAADYAVERGTGRALTKDEAIDMLEMCEDEGLVHVSENKQGLGHIICNCCTDCCINWASVRTGLGKFIAPSRYQAMVDPDECTGCAECVDRCFFEALSMDTEDGSATVNAEKCMGCGLCQVVCPPYAVSMQEVRAHEFVPA
jgi:Pyruvate/2-oxoacid:ferredoxin oxidoreductase delta subunit/predicted transcriptional regulator